MNSITKLSFVACLLFTLTIQAQNFDFYLGAETGGAYSISKLEDRGNFLKNRRAQSPLFVGGHFGLVYKTLFWTELGGAYRPQHYTQYCYVDYFPRCRVGRLQTGIELFNRYGVQFPVFSRNISISPSLGYRLNYSPESGHLSTVSNIQNFTNPLLPTISGSTSNRLVKAMHLLESSIKISYQANSSWRFSLIGRYIQGFRPVTETRLNYVTKESVAGFGVYQYQGTSWLLSIGVDYIFRMPVRSVSF